MKGRDEATVIGFRQLKQLEKTSENRKGSNVKVSKGKLHALLIDSMTKKNFDCETEVSRLIVSSKGKGDLIGIDQELLISRVKQNKREQ